jgi:hypothetical protein
LDTTFDLGAFSQEDERFIASVDRRQLRLGCLVSLRRDEDGTVVEVSVLPNDAVSTDGEVCEVVWIAPAHWVVFLQSKLTVSPALREQTKTVLKGHLDEITIDAAIDTAARDGRLRHLYKTEEYERSRLATINYVTNRLDLLKRFEDAGVAKRLFHFWESLYAHLIFTCFDALGQPAQRMDFSSWLRSRRAAEERENALASASSGADAVQLARVLYEAYSAKYGAKNSFYRFLREVLPADARRELLSSFRIGRLSLPPEIAELGDGSEEEQEDYLYRLRNEYTHSARYRGFTLPWLEELKEPIWRANFEQRFLPRHWESIYTLDWPRVLGKSLKAGYASYLSRLAAEQAGLEAK